MLFLWKTTRHGKIWLDGESLRRLVSQRLPEGYVCQEASFVGDQALLHLFVSLPEGEDPQRRLHCAQRVESWLHPSGIRVQIHWTERRAEEPATPAKGIWKTPLFWAAAGSAAVALSQLGFKGILRSVFVGVVAYGVAWVSLTEDGRKLVRSVTEEFRR